MRIPIFPLPNVVFFPHTALPLHIFEPRYRQMVADCLRDDKRLAVVLLKPGWERDYDGCPAVHPVAGAGEIVQSETLPDGRYNILLQGLGKIVIDGEVPSETLYRVATARWLEDVYPPGGGPGLDTRLDQLRQAARQLLGTLPQPVPALLRLLTEPQPPGAFVDRIASAVIAEIDARQRLLEQPDVEARIVAVTTYMHDLLARRDSAKSRWQATWN